MPRRRVVLVQLPIPPAGPEVVRGNIPLAAAFLKLFAQRQGFDEFYEIEILSAEIANMVGDAGVAQAIGERCPWLVGFTCYLWNVERSLHVAAELKKICPDVKILLGGPEITPDNGWVLEHPAVDYAVTGEGERAFCDFLAAMHSADAEEETRRFAARRLGTAPVIRDSSSPVLESLDVLSSVYAEGILPAMPDESYLLETVRGCLFSCKYCYYPKRYERLHFLSEEKIAAELEFAIRQGASEVFLLDPTINQRPDWKKFIRLLGKCNASKQLTFSGEIRAEGIDDEAAALLQEVGFRELEIGLQSVDPFTQECMSRKTNSKAWERGVVSLMRRGIRVRLDLIVGLPGDTVESIRRGIDYLAQFRPDAEMQCFHLSVLPGTAFRREAEKYGLEYQPRPPYYVYRTPTLSTEDIVESMCDAQETWGVEFDLPSLPGLFFPESTADKIPGNVRSSKVEEIISAGCRENGILSRYCLDLDAREAILPPAARRGLVFEMHFRSNDFSEKQSALLDIIKQAVEENPHSTLIILLEPTGAIDRLPLSILDEIRAICFFKTNYLDRFYSMEPGTYVGSKRLYVLLSESRRRDMPESLREAYGKRASIIWMGGACPDSSWGFYEHAVVDNSSKT